MTMRKVFYLRILIIIAVFLAIAHRANAKESLIAPLGVTTNTEARIDIKKTKAVTYDAGFAKVTLSLPASWDKCEGEFNVCPVKQGQVCSTVRLSSDSEAGFPCFKLMVDSSLDKFALSKKSKNIYDEINNAKQIVKSWNFAITLRDFQKSLGGEFEIVDWAIIEKDYKTQNKNLSRTLYIYPKGSDGKNS